MARTNGKAQRYLLERTASARAAPLHWKYGQEKVWCHLSFFLCRQYSVVAMLATSTATNRYHLPHGYSEPLSSILQNQ